MRYKQPENESSKELAKVLPGKALGGFQRRLQVRGLGRIVRHDSARLAVPRRDDLRGSARSSTGMPVVSTELDTLASHSMWLRSYVYGAGDAISGVAIIAWFRVYNEAMAT